MRTTLSTRNNETHTANDATFLVASLKAIVYIIYNTVNMAQNAADRSYIWSNTNKELTERTTERNTKRNNVNTAAHGTNFLAIRLAAAFECHSVLIIALGCGTVSNCQPSFVGGTLRCPVKYGARRYSIAHSH